MNKRILHVGNILNNGYLHCRFLRRYGIEADCLMVDYDHCQGQPEWAEVYIDHPVDQWSPDWSKVDLGGFKRPDWFFDVQRRDLGRLARAVRAGEPFRRSSRKPSIPSANEMPDVGRKRLRFRKMIGNAMQAVGIKNVVLRVLIEPTHDLYLLFTHIAVMGRKNLIKSLWAAIRSHSQFGKEFKETFPLKMPYRGNIEFFRQFVTAKTHSPLLEQYDLIHAYALEPVRMLLAGIDKPFICYEHGTLREFPHEESVRGNLYALSLKKAEKVIITNADCIKSAEELGLDNYVFIPHIIDDDLFQPAETPLRNRLQQETGANLILLSPTRHDWRASWPGQKSMRKGNDVIIRALGKIVDARPGLVPLLVLFEWGEEVDLSKNLIGELGLGRFVRWEQLQSKPVLKEFYNAADIVLDQFGGIGTFGAVVPEAMACGKPVILNFNEDIHHWCYPELPPVINATTDDMLTERLLDLIDNEDKRLAIGRAGRAWFLKHHGSKVVIDRLSGVYREVYEKHGMEWPFS